MLRHARTDPDGTRTFRDRIGRDAAFAGDPEQVARLADDPWHAGWRIYGSPSQADALFVLLRPDVEPADIPLDPGDDGWLALDRDDLEAFIP
jgi:hypothetical protein